MQKIINKLKGKFKALWESFKCWLIKRLGGYTFPPVQPDIKANEVDTVKVSASLMVNKDRYNKDTDYRSYIRSELLHILAGHIADAGTVSAESVVELNDDEYIVNVFHGFSLR